jgi:RNA recognition motif-containing protein
LTREGRGRDNTQTAQATRPHTPCGQEPYQQEDREGYTSEEEDEEYTSEEEDEEYTSQEDGEYTSEKAKVYVGNLHYDIVREDLDELFGQAGFVEFSEVSHFAFHYLCLFTALCTSALSP